MSIENPSNTPNIQSTEGLLKSQTPKAEIKKIEIAGMPVATNLEGLRSFHVPEAPSNVKVGFPDDKIRDLIKEVCDDLETKWDKRAGELADIEEHKDEKATKSATEQEIHESKQETREIKQEIHENEEKIQPEKFPTDLQ